MNSIGALAHPSVFPWLALVLGLAVGSFLNVVIHRLPKMMEREWLADVPAILENCKLFKDEEQSKKLADTVRRSSVDAVAEKFNLVFPRSRCPTCKHGITALENIPVISYLVLRGACSACGSPISVRYPLVELLSGVGAAYSAYHFGFGLAALGAAIFVWCTIALAFIDQASGYLPDDITLQLLWAGLLLNAFGTYVPLFEAVIGAAAGYLSLWSVYWAYKLVRGVEGMGFGDFKMNAAVGAFLGWKVLLLVILISSLVGLLFGLAQMIAAVGKWDSKFKFHFGPYIAIAGVIAMFWGHDIFRMFPALKLG